MSEAVSDPVQAAGAAMGRGDLCAAFDIAAEGMGAAASAPRLKYLQVLALARMGATEEAERLYRAHGLGRVKDLDCAALAARLAKDRAFQAEGKAAIARLRKAAAAYSAVFDRTGDPFPGVNAASLWFLAGEAERAREIATVVLAKTDPAGGYYDRATAAEALLVLGRLDEAAEALRGAAQTSGANLGALSTTRRQIGRMVRHIAPAPAVAEAILAPLFPGSVVFFCGHMFSADNQVDEGDLAASIDAILKQRGVSIGFGALACGSDIVIAERLLARGAELNVVLPFRTGDFIEQSVDRPGGWIARFEACLASAASVTHASQDEFIGDARQFSQASETAMGLARLKARQLDTAAFALAIWDGKPAGGATAGTSVDIETWRRTGGEVEVIASTWPRGGPAPSAVTPTHKGPDRVRAAYIFADFPGFSKISETALPAFWEEIMGGVARVLERHTARVLYRNTWGDGLYLVVDGAPAAARIAIDIHRTLARADVASIGLDPKSRMRIGAHFGPAFEGIDRVTGRAAYYGNQVSLTARIEPVTPSGAVYVTEAFAAVLALEDPDGFACDYVGQIELAKAYGRARMYRLARARRS